MTDLLAQLAETGFRKILIMGSVVNYRRRLALSLVKLLPKPGFSAMDIDEQGLPDENYDWSTVDLVLIDLSQSKQAIKNWYAGQARQLALPPTIFLDNKATVDDAGDLIRDGGADYIDLTRLNTRRLARALLIAADDRYQAATPEKDPDEQGTPVSDSFPHINAMNDEPTEMLPVLTTSMIGAVEKKVREETHPSFLTTGLMDILDRQKLKEQYESQGAADEVSDRKDLLTTGLNSILERGQTGVKERHKVDQFQIESITVGKDWPFTQQQIDEGTAEIDDYRILQFVEVGGTAAVFRAEDKKTGEECAIKLLDEEQGGTTNRDRFLRGYQLIQSVRHPNIVHIKDLVTTEDYTYVVMEYFPGGDLKQQIAQGVQRAQAVRYTVEIAAALNAAHEHDILHRDLKPSNVMLRDNGTLALLDFGIAKLMAEHKSDLTQTGFVVGTCHYISPEQALGKPLDARTDLYALGVILYEMLEGKRPYTGGSTIEIMQQHVRSPVPQLSSVEDPLNPIVGKLLAKEPDERFSSGVDVIDALRKAIPELVSGDFYQNL